MTRTVVLLELSQAAYDEIKQKVIKAEQSDRIMSGGAIDMFEIAVCVERSKPSPKARGASSQRT